MPIVTISRGSMSGGRTLAECLAKASGAECVGREILVEAAGRLGVPYERLRAKIESSPGLLELFSNDRRTYILAVQAALAARASTGNLVYHGQAGHLLLRGLPGVLRVRLIAPMPARAQAVMEQQRLSREAAEAQVRRLDAERVRWTRSMYDVDVRDPALYDLVINLEVLTISSACKVLQEVLRQPEYEVTDAVLAEVRAFAASSQASLRANQQKPRAPRAKRHRARVLVVDDEPDFADSVAGQLNARGFDATAVCSALEALAIVPSGEFDVVLLELVPGPLDALETVRELRRLAPATRVLVVTGHGAAEPERRGIQLGADGYLHKPVDIDLLCASIDAAATAEQG